MLVTVVRSYSDEPVELPDGCVLRPHKFVEYCPLPESMQGEALRALVDAGKVKVAQLEAPLPSKLDHRLPESVLRSGAPGPLSHPEAPPGVVPSSVYGLERQDPTPTA